MSDATMALAGDFDPVDDDAWMAAVEKVLRGRPFDTVLRRDLGDGIVTDPLYTAATRTHSAASARPMRAERGWDIRQRHQLTTVEATNLAILRDLERGVSSIELSTSGITDEAVIDAVLEGVLLDLAPVAFVGTGDAEGAPLLLIGRARRAGIKPADLLGDLGIDPIGALARSGSAGRPIDEAVVAAADLADEVAATHPGLRTLRADGAPFAHAGASAATELAATLSIGVTYARAMVDRNMSPAASFGQVLLATTVGTDQFLDIAKLRALRVMWARIAETSGVAEPDITIQASTSMSVLTRHDPWVNMLRATTGCLAAGVGGADIVLVLPFDALLGVPDELGLRIARNTQLVLMEESNVHRVADAAGGSWYLDDLTDRLAETAWTQFQDMERAGGIVAGLTSGSVQRRIAESWERTHRDVATRRRPITGVSEFADLAEVAVERSDAPVPDSPADVPGIEPLRPRRLAEDFERLRDAAAGADPSPVIFSANLGAPADHNARSTWAANFFASGGIATTVNDGFADDDAVAEAFVDSGCRAAVIAGSDAQYTDRAATTAAALVAAGADRIFLAGNPGEARGCYGDAGIDEFIHVGCDALGVLEATLSHLGVDTDGGDR